LANNQYSVTNSYLSNSLSTEETKTNLGNIGVVYKLPTQQGSFVIGVGYNEMANKRGISQLSARNNQSTITDVFREESSDYHQIAFNAYAIDWGDVDSTYKESVFRIGFDQFPGITQEAEITQDLNIGEYTFYFGTEFQENLFIGFSGGLLSGSYSYRRDFLEIDDQGDYNYDFIESPESGQLTDIDNILVHDEIEAEIMGFTGRAGLLYEVNPNVNVGLSYTLPSTMVVSEGYYSSIDTEFDDGSSPTGIFDTSFSSEEDYEYRVKRPAQLNLGFSVNNIAGFDFSLSSEFISYSNLNLDLISGNDLDFNEEVGLRDQQTALNDFMANNYKDVINYKAGLGYEFSELLKIKAGYAFFEGKSSLFEVDRTVFSGGFTSKLSPSILLDVNAQYSYWNDRSEVYNYYDYSANVNRSETVSQDVENVRIMAGLRFLF
jgi:opacity protein-like surface antigen